MNYSVFGLLLIEMLQTYITSNKNGICNLNIHLALGQVKYMHRAAMQVCCFEIGRYRATWQECDCNQQQNPCIDSCPDGFIYLPHSSPLSVPLTE